MRTSTVSRPIRERAPFCCFQSRSVLAGQPAVLLNAGRVWAACSGIMLGQHELFDSTGNDRSEIERLIVALDEYEAYWWSLKRSKELELSRAQQSELRRRAQFAFIDLD